MHVKDLRFEPPRRWNVAIDGIPWLPRLIDKTRAALAGTLGSYLYGQSPTDCACLRALGVGHRAFAHIVAGARDDADVLAALAARDPEALDRARAWGARLAPEHQLFLFFIDVDDGYAGDVLRRLKPLLNAATNGLTWTLKRVWPSRALDAFKRRSNDA